jgi:hypothetical protein
MELLLLPLLYVLPAVIGWALIYTAVLATLRRHYRDRV